MARLTLSSVSKSYGPTKVIHDINMEVESGDFCVFVGPSGCGKSTLLRMIAGLETITQGQIEIDGVCVNEIPAAMRGLAMVFQSYALYPHMNVRQNMSFGLENLNMPRIDIQKRVEAAAAMLQMEDFMDRRPGQLSGGQCQRVAIGRAIVREPKIFLFDEPLSNLDAELRVAMRAEISELHKNLGNTMIYVTHDQVEAMTMADKIAVLREGYLEQFGAPLTLFNHPANRFVAGFIGSPSMNFFKGRCVGDKVLLDNGAKIPLPDHMQIDNAHHVEVGVRAGDINLGSAGDIHVSIHNVEHLGSESYIYCETKNNERVIIYQRGQTQIRKGEKLMLRVNPNAMHLFDDTTGQNCVQLT